MLIKASMPSQESFFITRHAGNIAHTQYRGWGSFAFVQLPFSNSFQVALLTPHPQTSTVENYCPSRKDYRILLPELRKALWPFLKISPQVLSHTHNLALNIHPNDSEVANNFESLLPSKGVYDGFFFYSWSNTGSCCQETLDEWKYCQRSSARVGAGISI